MADGLSVHFNAFLPKVYLMNTKQLRGWFRKERGQFFSSGLINI
jgi:hypothetical protein